MFHVAIGGRINRLRTEEWMVNGVVTHGFLGKVVFKQSFMSVRRKFPTGGIENAKASGGSFTQSIYDVGEPLFSDLWLITGFSFCLSKISSPV